MGELGDQMMIVVIAIFAAVSFVLAAIPLVKSNDKRERYKAVIEKKRRDLFEQAKNQSGAKKKEEAISAREALAITFKFQEMMGEMGERVRDKLLQAGIRNPKAPMKYIMAQFGLPLFLVSFALLVMTQGQREFNGGTIMFSCLGAMAIGYFLPSLLVKNQATKRGQEINLTFPDALDMMLICVQGGMGLEQTVDRIAEEISEHSPILAEELGILSAEMAMLNDRRVALQDFGRRVGGGAGRSFASALIQAEQYGTSVSQALRVLSDEVRDLRMQAAEQKAASLPPKLTVPMILFFLPVLFAVILTPGIITAMSTL